jgi:hypothetical protein
MSTNEPLRHVSKKLLVVVVAAGALSVSSVAGVAAASTPASASAHRTHAEHVRLAKAFRKECHRTFRWLHREKKLTAHYDKHLKLLREAEAAAAKAGHGRQVKTLKHDIAHVRSVRKKTLGEKVFGLEPAKGKALSEVCLSLARNAAGDLKHHKHHKGNAAKRRALKEREAKAAAAKAAAATTTTTSPAKTTPTTTAPKPTPTTAPTTTTPPTTSTTVAPSTTTPSSTTSTTTAPS